MPKISLESMKEVLKRTARSSMHIWLSKGHGIESSMVHATFRRPYA